MTLSKAILRAGGFTENADKHKVKMLSYKLGTTVISTSKGLMTHREAIREGIGGETVCYVW